MTITRYTTPKTREEAVVRAEGHLSAARNTTRRPRFTFRLIDALLGVGYSVMALSLPPEASIARSDPNTSWARVAPHTKF